jgi:hypothetical protein
VYALRAAGLASAADILEPSLVAQRAACGVARVEVLLQRAVRAHVIYGTEMAAARWKRPFGATLELLGFGAVIPMDACYFIRKWMDGSVAKPIDRAGVLTQR